MNTNTFKIFQTPQNKQLRRYQLLAQLNLCTFATTNKQISFKLDYKIPY